MEPVTKGVILSVEDDENLQAVLEHYLESLGYRVVRADTAKAALAKAEQHEFNVVLLDLVLPDGEGLDLIPLFRTKTRAGIIVVSGKDSSTEKVVCLEMGADDYLTKPFEMRELAARIKAVLRRMEPIVSQQTDAGASQKAAERLGFGDGWCLDRSQFQLYDSASNSAGLTTGEFRLLEALVLAPNRALSREYLYEITRGTDYETYDRAIDIQIARLRKKLGDNTRPPDLIKTIRGVGYMLCADVSVLEPIV